MEFYFVTLTESHWFQ